MPILSLLKKHGLRWTVVTVSIFITLSLAGYHVFQAQADYNSFIKRLDFLFYDWRFNLMLDEDRFPRAEENIIIVDIDEKSLQDEGRWPWSRDKMATMVENLANAGTVVIGFDVLMTEPQRNPTRELQEKAIEIGRIDIAEQLSSFVDATEYDRILADSFSLTDIVLPFLFQNDPSIRVGTLPEPIYSLDSEMADTLLAVLAEGYTANVPVLQEAAIGAGFIVPSIDGDGVLRAAPIVQRFQNDIYPSLSLAMGMAYMFLEDVDLTIQEFSKNHNMISKVHFVDKEIFTDLKGSVLVPYLGGQGQFPYVSASDIVRNNFDAAMFENSLVLVGTSSVGLADLRSTPVGTQYPGVEVHANLLNGLLEGVFPVEPVEANNLMAVILVVLGLLYTVFSNRFGPFQLTVATIALLFMLVSINLYMWFSHNVSLPLASSFLLTLALGTLHLLEGFLGERRAKQHVTSVFGQYVPSAHISHMLTEPEKYGFEGETREMTVLFSDVRSFTTISENLSATELKDLLNRYFTPITETIFYHQGTIDKYVGDMVMAFWGAPLVDEKHAQRALEASVEMLQVLKRLNPELVELGYPELKVGIGLNTGLMNVGDMGSSFRKAYTVLGDAVNLGSRLESLTKFYSIEILVGPKTMEACPNWTFRFIDKIQVKGKNEPVKVYQPVGPTKKVSKRLKEELDQYEQAYTAYLSKEWETALTLFKELYLDSKQPEIYQIYIDRIELLSWQTLPETWDGTFTHINK
jgi:adenylate cyclase